ncbi:MAG: hypothetical protein R6V04_05820 [bacterium]
MPFHFTKKDFKRIEKVLDQFFQKTETSYRLVLENESENRKVSIEIFPDIKIGHQTGNLISVYTNATHLQLHFCSGYVVSEMLGEVTFVGEHNGRLSGLIIEKGAACSFYSNVDSSLLSGDFTQLGPEIMLSGIALSLAEDLLPEEDKNKSPK